MVISLCLTLNFMRLIFFHLIFQELEETLSERLWGLTEMFPQPVQKAVGGVGNLTCSLAKFSYTTGRNVLWIIASTATIMALPVVFESERATQQEQQMQHQRQVQLLRLGSVKRGGVRLGGWEQLCLNHIKVSLKLQQGFHKECFQQINSDLIHLMICL
jgi:import receptor subunit TOM22